MKIEDVISTDIEELKNLARNTIQQSVDATIEIKNEIITDTEDHIDSKCNNPACVFLKCTETDILGFILVQDYWNLSDLFVKISDQGRGVGRLLLSQAKMECKENGKSYIRVNSSVNAEGFYLKHGFVSYAIEEKTPDFVVPLIYTF